MSRQYSEKLKCAFSFLNLRTSTTQHDIFILSNYTFDTFPFNERPRPFEAKLEFDHIGIVHTRLTFDEHIRFDGLEFDLRFDVVERFICR